jgi:hypothetical protein
VELVDTLDLGSSVFGRGGSTPSAGTNKESLLMSSEKFIQLNFPCGDCLVSPACQTKPLGVKAKELYPMVLSMKKWDESKKIYRKGLIECWVNMGVSIIQNMRDSEFKEIPEHARPEFIDSLIEITALLEYMIHCTSWQKGQKFDFDISELQRRLDLAKGWTVAKR